MSGSLFNEGDGWEQGGCGSKDMFEYGSELEVLGDEWNIQSFLDKDIGSSQDVKIKGEMYSLYKSGMNKVSLRPFEDKDESKDDSYMTAPFYRVGLRAARPYKIYEDRKLVQEGH